MGWVFNATPRPLYPQERTGNHCIGGWVGPRAGLGRCGKSRPPPGFDPRTVQPVACNCNEYDIPSSGVVRHPHTSQRSGGALQQTKVLWAISLYIPLLGRQAAFRIPFKRFRSNCTSQYRMDPDYGIALHTPLPHQSSTSLPPRITHVKPDVILNVHHVYSSTIPSSVPLSPTHLPITITEA